MWIMVTRTCKNIVCRRKYRTKDENVLEEKEYCGICHRLQNNMFWQHNIKN